MTEQLKRSRERLNFTLSKTAIRQLEASARALETSKSAVVDQAIRQFWAKNVQGLKGRSRKR